MEVLEKIKILLGIGAEDNSKDNILLCCLSFATEQILNYCNLEVIPEKLENTFIAMIIDFYRISLYGKESIAGEEKSIKQGDTAIEYVTSVDILKNSEKNILNNYKSTLNRFRRVVFP